VVRRQHEGARELQVGDTLRSVTPFLGRLVGAGILAGIGIGVGLLLIVIPGLILMTIWAVLIPVIVVERTGVMDAFRRSQALVRGNGWQVFGVLFVLFVIQFGLAAALVAVAVGISNSFVLLFVAFALVALLVAPIQALAASTMYFELLRLDGERAGSATGSQSGWEPPAPAERPPDGASTGPPGLP
jgi:hypothetical protein